MLGIATKTSQRVRRNVIESLERRQFLSAGAIDPAFNGQAIVTTNYAGATSVLSDLIVWADGGFVAGGYAIPQTLGGPDSPQMALTKYTFTGAIDTSFGANGQIVATPRGLKGALDMAALDDGSFLVLGSSVSGFSTRANLLLKFTPDGLVDTTFGNNGKVSIPFSATSVAVGAGNIIYIAGQADRDGAVARYSPRGGLDLDFGLNGMFTTANLFSNTDDTSFFFDSISLDSTGRIYAAGTQRDEGAIGGAQFDVRAVRVDEDGSLDAAFGGLGFVSAGATFAGVASEGVAFGAIVVGPDDRPVLAAAPSSGEQTFISKLQADGSTDLAYGGGDGVAVVDADASRYPLHGSILEQVDGKILFAGATQRDGRNVFSVERLDANGLPDATYGSGGLATVTFKKIPGEARVCALAPDGTVVVGGVVGSVQNDGSLDSRRFSVARLLREEGPAGQLIPKTLRVEQSGFVFDIIWRDDDALNELSIDGGDLRVYGADGIARRAKLTSMASSSDGKIVTARYRLPALNGVTFNSSNNGLYTVKVQPNQVADDDGVFASRRTLGNIRIRIV